MTLAINGNFKNDDLSKLTNHSLPVLIIQKGGRIKYWNNELKELFGFSEGTNIDLNKMAKKAKGCESLFKVFNNPGTYEFEIEGQLVTVNSFDAANGMIVIFLGRDLGYHNQNLESSQEDTLLDSQSNKKSAELSELAKISYSLKQIHNFEELFSRIISSIESLFPFDIIGFILFDDHSQMLEAKKPFKGLPDPITEIIRIKILPNSEAERILYSQDLLITDNAIDDKTWFKLGLSHLANAASIKDSVLVPLSPGGDPMGFILAANHTNGTTTFAQDEIHLLMIISNQVAPIIENMHLLTQAKQRTQRSETLRRISALASSNATIDEILSFTINELSLLLQADIGVMFLLDQYSSKLAINPEATFGDWELTKTLRELSTSSSTFTDSVTNNKKPLLLGKFDDTEPIPAFYQEVLSHFGLQSAIIVPMISREKAIGEIMFGSSSLSFFDQGDIQIILSAANQLANIVEKESISVKALEALQEKIEHEKLIDDLQRINEFTRRISSLNELEILENLLDTILEFIHHTDSGWIGLRNERDQSITVKLVRNYSAELNNIKFPQSSLFSNISEMGRIFLENDIDFPITYQLKEDLAVQYLRATDHKIPTSCILAPIYSGEVCFGILMCEIFDKDKQFTASG